MNSNKTPKGKPYRQAYDEAIAAKSPYEHFQDGWLKGMAIAARIVGSAGLGDKGAGIIAEIARYIDMFGGLTDSHRDQESMFWHTRGLQASEAEQEAARKMYESPDDKPVADAECFSQHRRHLAKAQPPENVTD